MLRKHSRQKGFTIIEIATVIAVIGILVTIAIVNYNAAQAKSRDSKRLADASAIEAALEAYRSENSSYPNSTTATQVGGAATSGWETSGAAQPGTFITSLKAYGLTSGTPIDPVNNTLTASGKTYRYATYGAGTNGCDVNKGTYYVFIINDFETVSGTPPNSSGFSCPGRNWQPEGDFVFGHFQHE